MGGTNAGIMLLPFSASRSRAIGTQGVALGYLRTLLRGAGLPHGLPHGGAVVTQLLSGGRLILAERGLQQIVLRITVSQVLPKAFGVRDAEQLAALAAPVVHRVDVVVHAVVAQ